MAPEDMKKQFSLTEKSNQEVKPSTISDPSFSIHLYSTSKKQFLSAIWKYVIISMTFLVLCLSVLMICGWHYWNGKIQGISKACILKNEEIQVSRVKGDIASSPFNVLRNNLDSDFDNDICNSLTIVSRSEWEAIDVHSSKLEALEYPVRKVFFHHTVTETCTKANCSQIVKYIQNLHIGRFGFSDIGYHFLIGGDARVYIGRGWEYTGAHTYRHNKGSISIAFIGNYMKEIPDNHMLESARNLIDCGITMGKIHRGYGLYGHRDGSCTEGPGTQFYFSLQSWPHWHQTGEIQVFCRSNRTVSVVNNS